VTSPHCPIIGGGSRYTYPLPREEAQFVAPVPAELAGRDLVFPLTLTTGRVAWDLVPADQAATSW
jgi:hypothetical protein